MQQADIQTSNNNNCIKVLTSFFKGKINNNNNNNNNTNNKVHVLKDLMTVSSLALDVSCRIKNIKSFCLS